MESNIFNFAFCTDQNYAHPIPVIIESITRNISCACNFYVVYSSINDKDKNDIQEIAKLTNNNVFFIEFDVKKHIETVCQKKVRPFRNSYDAYTRIFLPFLLKPYNVDKCVYLDTDIVVNKNIDSMFTDLATIQYIGGCYDDTSKKLFDWLPEQTFNSGVLLLNLRGLEEINFTEKFLDYANENIDKYTMYDQDIINAVISASERTIVNEDYNQFRSSTKLVKKAAVIHYTGPFKPWMEACRWRYKKCMWVKYKWLYVLRKKGLPNGKFMQNILHFILVNFRIFFNLVLQIKLLFKKS